MFNIGGASFDPGSAVRVETDNDFIHLNSKLSPQCECRVTTEDLNNSYQEYIFENLLQMCYDCETYSLDVCCTAHIEIGVGIFTRLKRISSNFLMDVDLQGFIGHMTCQLR